MRAHLLIYRYHRYNYQRDLYILGTKYTNQPLFYGCVAEADQTVID